MCKVYERPSLVLSEGMKLFAVNAGYRKTDVGANWYYVPSQECPRSPQALQRPDNLA